MPEGPKPEKIERGGIIPFQIGDSKVFEVDAILFHNEVVAITEKYDAGDAGDVPEFIDLVRKWGGPDDVTAYEAIAVIDRVMEYVGAVKKKRGTPPSSASPTDSTAGPTTPKPPDQGSDSSP